MNIYKLEIEEDALQDIQNVNEWYNEQLQGLGSRFQKQIKAQINSLKKDPLLYRGRYAAVRCMIINKFPFMVHYTVDNRLFLVEVFGVIHTSTNPMIWKNKIKSNNICL